MSGKVEHLGGVEPDWRVIADRMADVLQNYMFWAEDGDEGNNDDVCEVLDEWRAATGWVGR